MAGEKRAKAEKATEVVNAGPLGFSGIGVARPNERDALEVVAVAAHLAVP